MAKSELEKTLKEINKKFGPGTIVKASEAKALVVRRVSSGSFALDVEMGGGVPVGRIIGIAGAYSSSKTTLALHMVREFLLAFPDKIGVWEDAEGVFDPDWAINILGEELMERLHIVQPKTSEGGMDIATVLIHSGDCCIFVLDSLSATVPSAEVEGSMEDWTMGLAARLNGKFLRKAQSGMTVSDLTDDSELPCTVIIISQLRETMDKYKPEVMTGGRALGFFSSILIWLRIGERYKVKDEETKKETVYAQEVKFRTEKNKTFAPFRQGSFDLYVDRNANAIPIGHIDRIKEVVIYATYWGIISRRGAWYYIGEHKWNGGEAVVEALRHDPELLAQVEAEVMQRATHKRSSTEEIRAVVTTADGKEVDTETGEILSV